MIKVKSFHDHIITDLDEELEDFIADKEIKCENILKLEFYAVKNPEDSYMYHYAKLVYENGK